MFVDNSGRRARLLRRIGMLVGTVCLGYAVVLGMAFMGWGTSLTPSSLFPFGGGGRAGSAPGAGRGYNFQPQGGIAPSGAPTGLPSGTPPSGVPTGSAPASSSAASASASASTSAFAGSN